MVASRRNAEVDLWSFGGKLPIWVAEAEMDDNCILELCDPDGLPVGQAIRLARAVSRVEPNLAPSLGAYVCYLADSAASDVRLMQRALELLCAVSDPRSFTATCERVKAQGNPVACAMVRWLAAGSQRRLERLLPSGVTARAGGA